MASWTKHHENLARTLIWETMDYLSEADAAAIKIAKKHAKEGLLAKVKDGAKDVVLGLIPGAGLARNVTDGLAQLRKAGKAGYLLSQNGGQEETHPYNYLADLFHKVVLQKGDRAENKMFVKHLVGTTATGASAAGGIAFGGFGGDKVGESVAKVLENAIEKGTDVVSDLVTPEVYERIAKDATKKELIEGIHVAPATWAVYLSARPRTPHSKTENCRLALRAILGMPHNETTPAQGVWQIHPGRETVVSPEDVCQLLDAKGKNAMIHGDVNKGYARIASFCLLGKVDETFTAVNKSDMIHKWHLAYLESILEGLGLLHCLKNGGIALQ